MAFPSSLIFFLLSHLLIFYFTMGENTSQSHCTESFECGSFGVMNFPFSKSSEPNCGLFVIDCDTKPFPRINIWPGGEWYDLLGAPVEKTTRIRVPSLKDRRNCIRFNNFSPPNPASISVTVFPNITLFKCPTSSIDYVFNDYLDDHFAGYEKFTDCGKEHGFQFHVYYNYTNETYSTTLPTPPRGCSIIQLPSVLFDPNLDPKDLNNLLAIEFDMEWHLSHDCYDCHQGGHQCFTERDHRFHCLDVISRFTSQDIDISTEF